jgi:hypothetical protein
MARVKSKQGKGGKKVDAGKVSKSSHQKGEPMVSNQGEIKAKKVRVKVRKECEREGCTTGAQSRGLCKKHGGGPRCTEPDCEKAAQKGGKCSGHGGYALTRMPCQIEGCCKIAQKGVYCREHAEDFCSVEGCGTLALRYGLCTAHGGGYQKPCYTEGCCNLAHKGGFCQTHRVGGHRTCRVEECGKWPAKGGMCIQHFKEAQDAASGN